jgi:hypothetical protein
MRLLKKSILLVWQAMFDLDSYTPTDKSKARLIAVCEAIKRNKSMTEKSSQHKVANNQPKANK